VFANFGFKSGTRIIDFASVPLIPRFASSVPQGRANLGIGTLALGRQIRLMPARRRVCARRSWSRQSHASIMSVGTEQTAQQIKRISHRRHRHPASQTNCENQARSGACRAGIGPALSERRPFRAIANLLHPSSWYGTRGRRGKYPALLSHDQDDCRGDGPATNTVRRVLQDLTAYGVARQGQGEGNPDLWGPPRQPTKETKKSATAEAGSAPDVEFTPRGKAVDSPGSVFISRSDFLNDDSGSPLGEFCRLR